MSAEYNDKVGAPEIYRWVLVLGFGLLFTVCCVAAYCYREILGLHFNKNAMRWCMCERFKMIPGQVLAYEPSECPAMSYLDAAEEPCNSSPHGSVIDNPVVDSSAFHGASGPKSNLSPVDSWGSLDEDKIDAMHSVMRYSVDSSPQERTVQEDSLSTILPNKRRQSLKKGGEHVVFDSDEFDAMDTMQSCIKQHVDATSPPRDEVDEDGLSTILAVQRPPKARLAGPSASCRSGGYRGVAVNSANLDDSCSMLSAFPNIRMNHHQGKPQRPLLRFVRPPRKMFL